MKGWICLAVFAIFFLVVPASAEWNQQTLLESDTYMQVFGVSDDGSKIVYIADTDGNDVTKWDRDVFLMDLNTGEVIRITRNLDQEVQAGISGDGNVIVYGTMTVGDRVMIKYYEVRGDEGWQTPRPLMHGSEVFTAMSCVAGQIAVNYDGRAILVPSFNNFEGGAAGHPYTHYFYDRSFRDAIWSDRLPVSRGFHFVVYDGEEYSLLVGETSNNFRGDPIITRNPYHEFIEGYSVSSDGKVVFSIDSDKEWGRKGIFLYDGRNTYQISQNPRPNIIEIKNRPIPTISGDGRKVFYLKGTEIHVMNSDGSSDSVVGSERGYSNIFTNYDGSKLFVWWIIHEEVPLFKLILYTPPELTSEYDRIRGINPNIQSSWLANSEVFIPPSTTIEFGSAEGTPGSEVQIPVTIRNAENIGAINLVLSYPTDVLQFEELLAGSLTQNSMIEHNVQDGNISVGIVDTEGISGDGSLFYLKFKVIGEVKKAINATVEGIEWVKKGGTQVGSLLTPALRGANSTLAILDAIVNDVDGNEVEVVTINGNFNLISEEEANKGDVNGDGVINSLDALLALQMSVGKLEPNMIADMNDDGKVLANDALEILKLANENMLSSSAIQMAQQLGKGGFKPGIHNIGR